MKRRQWRIYRGHRSRNPPGCGKLVGKLVSALRAELGDDAVPDGWIFERHYPGHWQRSEGAWSWSLRWRYVNWMIGSQESVADILTGFAHEEGEDGNLHVYSTLQSKEEGDTHQ